MPKRIQRPKRPRYQSLAAYRKDHGLTQRDAAAMFGMSQSAWHKIETGLRHPRKALLKRLVVMTGVPVEVLTGIAS